MTDTAKDFRTLKAELDALKCAYYGGKVEAYPLMTAKAKEAAQLYNSEAKRIAKKYNRRAKTITAASLMR